MSGIRLCPECGEPLRPGWRRWFCDTPGCRVDHVLLNRDGSVKEIVYVGPDSIGRGAFYPKRVREASP